MQFVEKYNKLKSKQRPARYRGQDVILYKPSPIKSKQQDKKLCVYVEDPEDPQKIRKVTFGHNDYEDYTIHRDKERQENYCARSGGIKCENKNNDTNTCPVTSANFWSRMVLWNC